MAARRLLGDLATREEVDTVLRALPHNPTTEMDLALWALADRLRGDAEARALIAGRPTAELADAYHAGRLPPALQAGLRAFLDEYGVRGVAEIDIGVARWRDDPSHILGSLANYLALGDGAMAPDAQFRKGAEEAQAMAGALARRARSRGRLRGYLVRLLLHRTRELAGVRERPKFELVRLLGRARERLAAVGAHLAQAGRIAAADDVYFLTLAELRRALGGEAMQALVEERRARHARELTRRHLPRLLLSDGTEPELGAPATDAGIVGTPASAGEVTGRARVVLDPVGARLEPGEILVAPSTDPGWTPLFLTAGGLVMEMGGAMSHGAVVAREYGIPAVVGVPRATERIRTGQRITVDGARGTVAVVE
jgi:pyruvate,water dikinase